MHDTSLPDRTASESIENQRDVDLEACVLEQCDSSSTLPRLVGSDLFQTSLDTTRNDPSAMAAAAAAADDDDDECDNNEPQQSDCVLQQRDSLPEESEDDANVDAVQPNIESESYIVTYIETQDSESQNLDQETLSKECQQCQTVDHLCQTPNQECQMLDEQRDTLDHHSETLHVDKECQTLAVQRITSDKQCQVMYVGDKALDQRCQSIDGEYQNVDKECQTVDQKCQSNSDDRPKSRQIETETQDVQCQTTQELRQLSNALVQTDDDAGMAVAATCSVATETDSDAVNQQRQATTSSQTTDAELGIKAIRPVLFTVNSLHMLSKTLTRSTRRDQTAAKAGHLVYIQVQ